ncbi:MAG TPA: hypothetical protein PKW29_13070 [Clostridia bacterium]|nr:hypothetical protein [Clostridia bacterium]
METQVLSFEQVSDRIDVRKRAADARYYHNAKKLIKIYGGVMWQLEHSIKEMDATSLDFGYNSIHEALNFLATGLNDELEAFHLEDGARSMLFSRSLIQLVDKALLALKDYPIYGERYFDIINRMYILRYAYSEDEMITALGVSRRTLYREKKRAVSMLGAILWGYLLPGILHSLRGTQMTPDWHADGTTLAPMCD